MRGSAAAALASLALTLVPAYAMARDGACTDLEVRVESVRNGSRPAVGQCFGIGSSVDVPPKVEVKLSRVRDDRRMEFELGPGPTRLSFVQEPKGLAAVLVRGRAIASALGETLGLRAERGRRFTEVWVNSAVEMEVGAQGQVRIQKIEGDIRVARAVKLKIGEGAGKTRRKPEDQYFDDMVDLSDEEFTYSLVEDAYLDVDDCLDYFEDQLGQDQRDGLGGFLAESYRNLGECCLIDGDWDGAIDYFQRALEEDRELYGEMDASDVAEDHRALGDAYLERALGDADPEQGSLDLAIENFEKARRIDAALLESDPQDWVAAADLAEDLYLLSEAWHWRGNATRAEELTRQAEHQEQQARELEAQDEAWEYEDEAWEYEDDTWESPDESWESEEGEGE